MTTRKQCENLYKEAFGESQEFDSMLFDLFFEESEEVLLLSLHK